MCLFSSGHYYRLFTIAEKDGGSCCPPFEDGLGIRWYGKNDPLEMMIPGSLRNGGSKAFMNAPGEWNFVVVTYGDGYWNMYINGIK